MNGSNGTTGARVRAPELAGRGGWLNTGGRSLRLSDLRGRFVLLDFWTFCCVNCLHVLEELRTLEAKYADILVVIGVHSPKFVHEADPAALRAAVARYAVRHPVLDDPDLTTWKAYAARAWPTLTLIDPEGSIVSQFAGEGHGHAIDALLAELVPAHDARSTLHRAESPFVASGPPVGDLQFPSRVVRLPDGGRLLVADAGGHSLAVLSDGFDGFGGSRPDIVDRIGSRERGFLDGPASDAAFREPNGICVLPPSVAERVGYDIVVADTVNHALRGVLLSTGEVRTLAGTGQQWVPGDADTAMSSPWDVAWFNDQVWIAMAGIHQLWTYDPVSGELESVAGTRNEGLEDGPLANAWFAQPSGLAVSRDGSRLWLVDAETSSLRYVADGAVHTVIGEGLFDFGHRDGPASQALLQHPLGLCVLPDDSIAIADTYNGAVRRYDPASGSVTTLAVGLAEPSDVLVDEGSLLVVESAAHRLVRLPLDAEPVAVEGFAHRTQRPPTELAPGEVDLLVRFEPPPGQKLDTTDGPPTRLHVSATPAALLREGSGRGTELSRRLVLDPSVGSGVLHIAAMAATCDVEAEYPVCHMHQQDWGVPVVIREGAEPELRLVLAG